MPLDVFDCDFEGVVTFALGAAMDETCETVTYMDRPYLSEKRAAKARLRHSDEWTVTGEVSVRFVVCAECGLATFIRFVTAGDGEDDSASLGEEERTWHYPVRFNLDAFLKSLESAGASSFASPQAVECE